MDDSTKRRFLTPNRFTLLAAVCFLGAILVGILAVEFGSTANFEVLGIPTASRTLNQFTMVVLTCIALIVPLTANLYSPKLVRLYVTHPMIVAGLSLMILTHLMTMGAVYFPRPHPWAALLTAAISVSYLVVLTGALPFLYGVSQFLRPAYFLPMLTRKALQRLDELERHPGQTRASKSLFNTVDVVTNIALTGMTRGDRQLVLLALQSLHAILCGMQGSPSRAGGWRDSSPSFVPGLAKEGQEFLAREKVWPEAYLIAQMLKVMEVASNRQHELMAELAGLLVDSARRACTAGRDRVVELHLMAINTLMREAIEAKDLRRFQNLSYHYRLLCLALVASPIRMGETLQHHIHYGRMAQGQDIHFSLETVVYDLGELALGLGALDQELAIAAVRDWAGPLWRECMEANPFLRKASWRALVRVHWESRARGLAQFADWLSSRFLKDEIPHREQLARILADNRELHFEFNDRLMRFAQLSKDAESLARAFLETRPA
jgi:hypothetical protein